MEDVELEAALNEAMEEVLAEGTIIQQPLVSIPLSDHNRTDIYLNYGVDTSAPPVEDWLGLYTDGPAYEFCRRCYTRWPPEPVVWFEDFVRDELCCGGCGSVRAERSWPTASYSSCHKYTNLPSKSKGAGVLCMRALLIRLTRLIDKRRYHFHERLSQRNNSDPRVPREVVAACREFLASGTGGRPIITDYEYRSLDRATLHDALRSIGQKKFCERWVQVRQGRIAQRQSVSRAGIRLGFDPQTPHSLFV